MKNHRNQDAHRYLKIVRWSDEDGCYVGSCPPIIGECCHGATEAEVIDQLVTIVDDWVDHLRDTGEPLPSGTNGTYSGRLTLRIDPALHRALALRAVAEGDSLNHAIERRLAASIG